jgi:WD40 repeat protein
MTFWAKSATEPYRTMTAIFISHSSKDHNLVQAMRGWLVKQGHTSYFLDFDPDKGIVVGQRWEDQLYRHLRLCRAVIALVTPDWLASRWCFAEVVQARAAGKPIFLAKMAPCETSSMFSDSQHVDLVVDPHAGYRALDRGLKQIGLDPADVFEWDPLQPPYPGLLCFEEEQAAVFFGRDLDIQKGLERLDSLRRAGGPPFLLLLGASGSGKSSLMRAGLIPRLRKDSRGWLPIAPFRPQEDPCEELAVKLARAFEAIGKGREWQEIYQLLTQGEPGRGLVDLTRSLRILAKQEEATVLLAIDQAEELFGSSNIEKVRIFLHCLRGALASGGRRLMAIATLRSDTLASFQTHPDLAAFSYETLTVDPIPLRDLPPIIEGPARLIDLQLDPGLVQRLVHETQTADALPLLAFTLRELYERYGGDRRLEIKEYEALGQLEGAVRRVADGVIEAMQPHAEDLIALREAFVPMMVQVSVQDTFVRRRAVWDALPIRARPLLERFIAARLLVSSGEGGRRLVEVAHEALFLAWPRLEGWLREDRDRLRLLRDLQRAAQDWQGHGCNESWLIHQGERLEAAEMLTQDPRFVDHLSGTVTAYLVAGIVHRQEEKARAEEQHQRELEAARRLAEEAEARRLAEEEARREAERRVEEQERRAQESLSRQLAAQALSRVDDVFDLALLLSVEANLACDTFEARSALYSILQRHSRVQTFLRGLIERRSPRIRPYTVLSPAGETETQLFMHPGLVQPAIAFSPDGNTLASVGDMYRHEVVLWDVATRQPRRVLFSEHAKAVDCVAFSPDGRILASTSEGLLLLWDVTTGTLLGPPLGGHTQSDTSPGGIMRVAFSPDGKVLASGRFDATLLLWDVHGHECAELLTMSALTRIFNLTYSPSGRFLAVVGVSAESSDELITVVWDLAEGRFVGKPLPGQGTWFGPEGEILALIAPNDRDIVFWDVTTSQIIERLETSDVEKISCLARTEDGVTLASGHSNGTIVLWDVASHQPISEPFTGHTQMLNTVAFSPDGAALASIGYDNAIILWNVAQPRSLGRIFAQGARESAIAFNPDGSILVEIAGAVYLWDVATGQTMRAYDSDFQVETICFRPGSNTMAALTKEHTVRWLAVHGECALVEPPRTLGQVTTVAFSPNGELLALGCADGRVVLWSITTECVVQELLPTISTNQVTTVTFSPDGQLLASGYENGVITLWNTDSGAADGHLTGFGTIVPVSSIVDLSFHPQGDLLLSTGEEVILLWDVATQQLVGRHNVSSIMGGPMHATFSPDGMLLAWATMFMKYIGILDAKGRRAFGPSIGYEGSSDVWSFTFSPDSKTLACAYIDGTIMFWDFAIESWETRACAIANRNLTPEEWGQYLGNLPYRKTTPG